MSNSMESAQNSTLPLAVYKMIIAKFIECLLVTLWAWQFLQIICISSRLSLLK